MGPRVRLYDHLREIWAAHAQKRAFYIVSDYDGDVYEIRCTYDRGTSCNNSPPCGGCDTCIGMQQLYAGYTTSRLYTLEEAIETYEIGRHVWGWAL